MISLTAFLHSIKIIIIIIIKILLPIKKKRKISYWGTGHDQISSVVIIIPSVGNSEMKEIE